MTRTRSVLLVLLALSVHVSPVRAVPLGSPTLLLPTAYNTQGGTLSAPKDPRDAGMLDGYFFVPDVGDTHLYNNGVYYGVYPVSTSEGFYSAQLTNTVDVYADSSRFEAKASVYTIAGNGTASATGTAGVATWYVLSGPAGSAMPMYMDLLVQGTLYRTDDFDNTAFLVYVNYLSSRSDVTLERVIVFNGADSNDPPSFSLTGTVPDALFTNSGTVNEINYVIRSNLFWVWPNVPFRLSLSVNTTAAVYFGGSAEVDFFDPGLVPDSWRVDMGSGFEDPSFYGYEVRALNVIPEPATLTLLAVGLLGLPLVRRGRRGSRS